MKSSLYHAKKCGTAIVSRLAQYIFLIAYSYVLLYPLLYIVVNTFKSPGDYLDPTVQWVPKEFTLQNLKLAMETLDFWDSIKNTVVYELVGAVLEIVSCAVAAYGLARFQFKGKKLLMGAMILTILIPSTMIIIPSYVNYRNLDFFGILGLLGNLIGQEIRPNIIGTPLVFYLPSLLGVGLKGGLFIYIYTQFFKGLPKELEEAAWIDGAGPWKTFLKIIVPSSGVAVVTVSLFAIIWHWNDYYLAQMYLSPDTMPLSVRLANLPIVVEDYSSGVTTMNVGSVLLAGCFLFVMPMLIMYIIMQKRFVTSIANSGIVG